MSIQHGDAEKDDIKNYKSQRYYDDERPLLTSKRENKTGVMHRLWQRIKPQHPWRYYLQPKNYFLALLTLALILVATTNRVFFKKMLIPMTNYPYFISQLSTLIYLPVFWPIVWYFQLFTKRITPEMERFPNWKFAIMGTLDSIAGVMMIFGGNQTSGPMQQLLIQGVIPFTMFFSWLVSSNFLAFVFRKILNVHYRWGHYLGAAIIMGGIVVALTPHLFLSGGSKGTSIFGVVVFFLSNVPTAFSGVYKEIAFKGGEDLDIYYVNAWVSFYQFVIGLLFAPVTAIPGFGGLTFPEIPKNIGNGAKCLATINSESGDDCEWAWVMVLGYVCANILYNIVILLMLKYGSAALLYVASAVVLPLANISFTFKFIMGSEATSLSPYDIGGLVVILVGLVLYRAMREAAPSSEAADEEKMTGEEKEGEVTEKVPVMSLVSAGVEVPLVTTVRLEHKARSISQVRNTYFARLGMRSPTGQMRGDEDI